MVSKFEFDEDLHEYRIDGTPVVSVTQAIERTVGSGFEFLSKEKAEFVKQRGRAIHMSAAFVAEGIEFDYDERIEGWLAALRRFFAEVRPEVLNVEMPLYSKTYQFAGTLDLDLKLGKHCLADYKSSVEKERLRLQLAGYSILYKETFGKEINRGFGIELKGTGNYKMTTMIDLRSARRDFLTLLSFLNIQKRINGRG